MLQNVVPGCDAKLLGTGTAYRYRKELGDEPKKCREKDNKLCLCETIYEQFLVKFSPCFSKFRKQKVFVF